MSQIQNFHLHNTCKDGWRWNMRNFRKTSQGFGNGLELNPADG